MNEVEELLKEKNDLEQKIKEEYSHIRELEKYRNTVTYKYRIASANRILDHIRTEVRSGRLCDLEILLCHCQNKLNGNIDGIELDLKEGVPFKMLIERKGKQ